MPLWPAIMWAAFFVLNVWTWLTYEDFNSDIVKLPIWVYWFTIPATAAFAVFSYLMWRRDSTWRRDHD